MTPLRITVWNEFRHERRSPHIQAIYPNGLHQPIIDHLNSLGFTARAALLDDPEHGLTDDVLETTDVLTWWGHMAHGDVSDAVVDKVHQRVLQGMGLIVLHSGHYSKIFKRLMGTTCSLKWREAHEKERHWIVNPGHPIVDGLGEYLEIPAHEMYGEFFDVPAPDETIFIAWYPGGEVFRSGLCYHRGRGKVFYFSPGHETYPVYYQSDVLRVIENAVRWAAPAGSSYRLDAVKSAPIEPLASAEPATGG